MALSAPATRARTTAKTTTTQESDRGSQRSFATPTGRSRRLRGHGPRASDSPRKKKHKATPDNRSRAKPPRYPRVDDSDETETDDDEDAARVERKPAARESKRAESSVPVVEKLVDLVARMDARAKEREEARVRERAEVEEAHRRERREMRRFFREAVEMHARQTRAAGEAMEP